MRYQASIRSKRSFPVLAEESEQELYGKWELEDFDDLIHANRMPMRSVDGESARAQLLL